jgi:hypothetical protein
MINFSTEFPIDQKNTVADVLRLACGTIASSPHTKISAAALAHLPDDGETESVFDNERVTVGIARGAGFEIGGVRYSRIEKDSLEWVITSVTIKTSAQQLLSIRVSCDAFNTAIRLPAPRKPYFIREVIAKLGGGMDGSVPVTDQAFRLTNEEVKVAADLILGLGENRLPIVYVSATTEGFYIADPARLAKMLAGMAHVVVEPNRVFSTKLKPLVDGRNVYGGTVAVYWPESNARKSYYITEELGDAEAVQLEISKDIRVALSHRRQMTECSWMHLKETISRGRHEKLKADGSTELNEFIEAFDSDLKAKENRIAEAEGEIARLNAEVKKYASAHQSATYGILKPGQERDFYEGEIQDIVVDAIEGTLRSVSEESRRAHVLNDLLTVNNRVGNGVAMKEEVKAILKTGMDSKSKGLLGKIGFDISEDGKHYKAVFHGDGRYTFAIAKTGSDHRGGKNMASDINKKLF